MYVLTMHELSEKKEQTRTNFDDLYEERRQPIDKMTLTEVKEYRVKLRDWLLNVDTLSKEEGITHGRKMYLRGLRKIVILNLLKYSKDRIKIMNVVVCNGTNINHASRFVRHAADILPFDIFQTIYGLSMSEEEKRLMTIESVKKFMDECKKITEKKGYIEKEENNEK